MKKLIAVFAFLIIVNNCFSQTGWVQLQSGLSNNLKDIYFVNSQTGWAAGDSGKVIKTTNGGASWFLLNSGTNIHLNAIRFLNELTGWAVGGWTSMGYAYTVIIKTADGGNNWTVQPNPDGYTNIIYDLQIFSATSALIASAGTSFQGFSLGGGISGTTNGGINWNTILGNYTYGPDAFTSLSFINQNTGWAGVMNQADVGPGILKVYKTSNAGSNWSLSDSISLMTVVNPANTLQKVQFIDNSTGYLYSRSYLRKTTNGGVNWINLDSASTSNGYNYFFVNKDTGWIVKNTQISKTINGGVNWYQLSSPSTGLKKIFFLNALTGWAAGDGGKIFKTISGGMPVDTSAAGYVPMGVGNVYTYYCSTLTGNSYTKLRVTKDTVAFGHRYYYYEGVPGIGNGYTRLDSATGLLLQLYPSDGCGSNINDKVVDSLSAGLNDSLNYCLYYGVQFRRCTDTSGATLFGSYNTKKKTFYHDGYFTYYISYAKNIGIHYMSTVEVPPNYTVYTLKGCKVNGTVYGDTNVYYSVSGNVYYTDNSQFATGGYVKAIKLDRNTYNIITFDSVQIQSNGSYTLTHVPKDSVDIGVYPNSNTQNDWVVAYYPSTIYWQSAVTVYPTGNITNLNIGTYRLISSSNNNSVNGKVMSLNDNPLFANLKDAVLYAKSGNTFVRCGISDVNGVYHLPYLPTGSIKIIVDRPGFRGDSTNVTTTISGTLDSVNFYLYKLPVGINQIENIIPAEYKLYQNYPNPFNPNSIIRFQIKDSKLVTLKVYNILGKEIATLVSGNYKPGMYEVSFDGSRLPSGIYFYKLTAGDFTETKKMLMIK